MVFGAEKSYHSEEPVIARKAVGALTRSMKAEAVVAYRVEAVVAYRVEK